MLSSDSLKEISNIFCGDTAGFYTYKQGYKLVEFFNANFGTKDVYRSGFPSRWAYVHDKLVDLINRLLNAGTITIRSRGCRKD